MNHEPSFDCLLVGIDSGVATITLNRPHVLNAFTPQAHRELISAFDHLEANEEVRVIVIHGAGRAFCSGSDIKAMKDFRGQEVHEYIELDYGTKYRVATCTRPVIAAMHGHVAGGGFELALACDLRFVADDVLFSLPEITLGTIPGSGGMQRLPRVVGLGIAKEWAFTGRRIDAAEAYRTGLANKVFPPDELMPETRAFAAELTKRSHLALWLSKVALDPEPPSPRSLTGTFHKLTSQVCRELRGFAEQTGKFAGDGSTKTGGP